MTCMKTHIAKTFDKAEGVQHVRKNCRRDGFSLHYELARNSHARIGVTCDQGPHKSPIKEL